MTLDEVTAFLARDGKVLPAAPDWREVNRSSERRATMPIEVDGVLAPVDLQLVTNLRAPTYLVILLLSPRCISRLCLGKAHRDIRTRELVTEPHFHGWGASGFALDDYDLLPSEVASRDVAFTWFLRRVGIDSPNWLPIAWPGEKTLV